MRIRVRKLKVFGAIFLIMLSGCMKSQGSSEENYYFSLTGESDNWKVKAYEIMIQPGTFIAGNGKITTKKDEGVVADFFSAEVHAVRDGNDEIIQRRSITGRDLDFSESTMGTIKGEGSTDNYGETAYGEQLSDVYMLVKWRKDGEAREERIDLYDKGSSLNQNS